MLPGYEFIYVINPNNIVSGIGVFIQTSLCFTYHIRNDIPGSEAISINIKLPKINVTLHCIYHHPGLLPNEFIYSLNSLKTKNAFIIGDININPVSYTHLTLPTTILV